MITLRSTLLSIIAATGVAVAVAWACAAFAVPGGGITLYANFGNRWPVPTPEEWPAPARVRTSNSAAGVDWTQLESDPGAPAATYVVLVAAGWPLRALRGWQLSSLPTDPQPQTNHWAVDLSDLGAGIVAGPYPRLVPLQPTWGLAVNAAAFSVPILGVVWLLGLRRSLRTQRLRCIECGHQLLPGQDRCPECAVRRHSA